ncbi:hypothetical protein ENUP19_0150G0022, partial [Entamoeba nuttalli]
IEDMKYKQHNMKHIKTLNIKLMMNMMNENITEETTTNTQTHINKHRNNDE